MGKSSLLIGALALFVLIGLGIAVSGSSIINKSDSAAAVSLADDSITMDIQNTPGLKIEVLQEGSGPESKNGDNISVDYTGMLTDGKVFDSSVGRAPFTLTLGAGQVIKGWEQGLLGMKVGEKRKLTIPSDLAYGKSGYPGAIPADATLIFDVELKTIK